jgi:signal transduction histidine kinase
MGDTMKLNDLVQQKYGEELAAAGAKASESRMQDLEMILSVVREINTSLILTDTLDLVLDEAIKIAKAERGFIMLANKERKLEFVTGRDANGKGIMAESFQVSSSVLEDVFEMGESMCVENALNDGRFESRQSIMNLELQTIICSPLTTPGETIGVIYVDSRYIQSVQKADVLFLFEILAGQAATAIKNARLYQDLHSAYEDLRVANEQIIKSERMAMKGEIAGQVSHELKNIVAVVVMQLEILRLKLDRLSRTELREIIEKTMEGTRRIQNFSNNLLTRSRAAGKLLLGNPNVTCSEFYNFIKVLPKFKHRELSLVLGEGVPEIQMDIDQIHQVLLNLVNNAVEAFGDAAITLQTEYDVVDNVVRISVNDNGPGIDEAIRNKLFNENITTKVNGHGYGLPICRQIVEHHGGTIRLESRKDCGAKFIMTFPVATTSANGDI